MFSNHCDFFYISAYDTLPHQIDNFQGMELYGHSLTGPTSPYEMDMGVGEIGAGELLDSMPSPPIGGGQTAAWFDTEM